MKCFEQLNIKDLAMEEAQEQFLTLISSYRYTFGSYFIVRRKPPQGLLLGSKKSAMQGINSSQNISGRKQFTEELRQIHLKK